MDKLSSLLQSKEKDRILQDLVRDRAHLLLKLSVLMIVTVVVMLYMDPYCWQVVLIVVLLESTCWYEHSKLVLRVRFGGFGQDKRDREFLDAYYRVKRIHVEEPFVPSTS